MDSNVKDTNLDVTPRSEASVVFSSLPTINVVSAEPVTTQPEVSNSNLSRKQIIRKIIPLDPKKLQQAGLGRQIAEALCKQKSYQSIKRPGKNVDASLPSHLSQIQPMDAKNLPVPKSTSNPLPAKNIDTGTVINKLKPPKITITGPDTVTEVEKQNLANLNSQQRLVHVKNLLNKKIHEKKSNEMNDNAKTNQLLQTSQAIGNRTQQELPTKAATQKPTEKIVYVVLKETDTQSSSQSTLKSNTKTSKDDVTSSIKAAKPTKTTQKSPQDIARKLIFQTDTPNQKSLEDTSTNVNPKEPATDIMTNTSHPDNGEFFNSVNRGDDVIPKASIMSANVKKQNKTPKQYTRKPKRVAEELPPMHHYPITNNAEASHNFQRAYMVQQNIVMHPKPSTNTTIIQSKLPMLYFPEVSPTTNELREPPLPAIDSFNKPSTQANANAYINLQQQPSHPIGHIFINYESSLFNQQPAPSHTNVNLNKAAMPTNSLVVLENKILSQDEMIDLTELRLPTNTPRFIHPHRPIPEVVIKQEHPDDYHSSDVVSLANSFTQAMSVLTPTQDTEIRNNEKPEVRNSTVSNQQKKVIINAQKLKLPPEQLAELARKIKNKTTAKKTKPKETKRAVKKQPDTCILNSNVSNKISPIKNSTFILPQHAAMVDPTSNTIKQNFVLPYSQMHGDIYNQDHGHYSGQTYSTAAQTSVNSSSKSLIEPSVQSSTTKPQFYLYYSNSHDTKSNLDMTRRSLVSQVCNQSAVEILDEVVETEDSFSAVDFIATLNNANAELSPEELNLNASCRFSQSLTPVKVNVRPQNTTSPLDPANDKKNLLKGTIVIESSKGQETILTNESPYKNNLEKVKEKIKIYYEMNEQNSEKPKSSDNLQLVKHTCDVQSSYSHDSKLYNNANVHNMGIQEFSRDERSYVAERKVNPLTYTEQHQKTTETDSPRRRESLGKTSLITKTSISTSATALEPPSKPPTAIDLSDRLETPTTKLSNVCEVSVAPKEQTKITQTQADNSGKTADEQTLETMPFKFSQPETSEKTAAITQFPPETGISKSNETVSKTAIASKRVSKFKKGKINLVSRNKPLTVDKKNADENVTNNKVEQTSDEKKSEHKIKVYIEPPSKSLHGENTDSKMDDNICLKSKAAKNSDEKKTACNQVAEQCQNKLTGTSQHGVEGDKEEIEKATTHSDKQKEEVVELGRIEKANQQLQTSKQETLPQDLTTERPQNISIALNPEAAEKILQRDSFIDTIDALKDSYKTTPSTSTKSFKELASEAKTTQVTTKRVQSLAKETAELSKTVAMKSTEKCDAQANISEDKSAAVNLIQESPNQKGIKEQDVFQSTSSFETTQKFAVKVANKEEGKCVKISQQSSENATESAELPSNTDNNQTSRESSKIETSRVKEENFESNKKLSQQFVPKALAGSMEKDQQSETEQKLFGLPKTITGRMEVIQERKKTHRVEVNDKKEEQCSNIFESPNKEHSKGFAKLKNLASEAENETIQSKMAIPETTSRVDNTTQQNFTRFAKPKALQTTNEKSLKVPKSEKTEMAKSIEENSKTVEHLNSHSQAVLQTMKSAKISLIDIAKHSPIEQASKSPIIPFKKSPSGAKSNVPAVSGLWNELKKGSEPEQKLPVAKKLGRETRKDLTKKEEQQSTSKSSRISSRTSEDLTPPAPKITRQRLSLRLISDDDLEFLPENAEINFNLTTSKQKEENTKSNLETLRQSLYTSNLTKRNRYYSQTLETDVTITFDNLKTKTNPLKNVQNLVTEESCHDSTQDSSFATPIKQRKKLRKTVEDMKKSQKVLSDTDSDGFQSDYGGFARDCDESNEFLGFEDTPTVNSGFDKIRHNTSDTGHESANKVGGLKNWLTTGKAISPTLGGNTASRKRLRDKNASPVAATSLSSAVVSERKQQINVRKRWGLCSKNAYAETDITDDTSPAHDEELISEQIPLQKKLKRGIKNVTDSNKNAVDSKKLKLNEHIFKPMAHQELSTDKNISEKFPSGNESENCKQTNAKEIAKSSKKENKNIELKVSPRSRLSRGKHPETTATSSGYIRPKDEDCSNITPEDKISNRAESQKSKRYRKCKANQPAQQEISDNTRNLRDIDDNSNSLLTPLNMSSVSPGESDNDSLLTPLYKTDTADSLVNTSTPKTKRVRHSKLYNESNFNSRLLLITKREQLETDEILTETSPGSGSIQCGLCLARTQPSQWSSHLAQHYGIGWKVGQEKLNVESRSVVLSTIANYMKNNKCTGLACRMCSKVLRSHLGILTHIEQCGNQERLACEFCQRRYAKTSLIIHLRTCKVRYAVETETIVKEVQVENSHVPEKMIGNSGRLKRHSTIKAENKLKVLGKELDNFADIEKPVIDPKLHIKYVPHPESKYNEKWSNEIKNVGRASCPGARCHFTGTQVNELTEHLQKCKHMKTGYICNFCRKAFKTEKEAIAHITTNHQNGRKRRKSDDSDCGVKIELELSSDESEVSEGDDENESDANASAEENELDDHMDETPKKRGKASSKVSTPAYHRVSLLDIRKGVFSGRSKYLNHDVLKKWCCFTELNYSWDPLYNEFTTQYSVLNYPDYKKYLPTQTVSMKFNFSTKTKLIEPVGVPETDIKWSELKRFETINNQTHTYFFLGAPIKICTWLPLPTDVNEQFLAVVYRQDMFKYLKFKRPKQHHSIVLLFKVTQRNIAPELNLHYGFVIDDGPIHHLSFLPSGGYDKSTNRLGLLAVATVTSCIKVYSLPLDIHMAATPASTETCNAVDNITLIEVKPSFLLNLDVSQSNDRDKQQDGLLNSQCLQICWSEFSGHHHIFAGFSNGFAGIWNIKNNPQENLNRFVIDDVINYTPLNYFFLGEKNVKCLALHYDTLGPRWLAATTTCRKLLVFDINNLMNPVVYKDEVPKNIILSLDWCPIWETFLISYDDALPNTGNGVVVVNPTNVTFQHTKLDGAVTGVSQAHYSPTTNMCVTALNNGEIVFLDTKELHFDTCLSKKAYERRAFYALDLKKLDGEPLSRIPKGTKPNDNVDIPSDWIMHDPNYKEKYGLMFTPLLKLDDKSRKSYMSEKRTPPQNVLNFMRVNTLRCNTNQQGKYLVAAGYENGFLRLIYFNKQTVFKH